MKIRHAEEVTVNYGHYENHRVRIEVELDSAEFAEDLTIEQLAAEARLTVRTELLRRLEKIKSAAKANPDSFIHDLESLAHTNN